MGRPRLRFAVTEAEREAAYRLRYELYVEDQGLFFAQADHARRRLCDASDAHAHLLLAELDGALVGTARVRWGGDQPFSPTTREDYALDHFAGLVAERDMVVLTRLVVCSELRGGSLGTEMIRAAATFALEQGAELFLGSCEPHLLHHYAPLGFQTFGELIHHPTNGTLARIVGPVRDLDLLRHGAARRWDEPTPAEAARVARIRARLREGAAVLSEGSLGSTAFQEAVRAAGAGALPGLLAELDPHEACAFLKGSHLLRCRAGGALFRRGHVSRTLYLLVAGSLELRDGGLATARLEKPGALFGESALLTRTPRLSDAVVGPEGAQVLAIRERAARGLLAGGSPGAAILLQALAHQLCAKLRDSVQELGKAREQLARARTRTIRRDSRRSSRVA